MAFVSSITDVVFVDTTSNAGVIFMPSTFDNIGLALTFKDSKGTFQRSTITFSTLSGNQTFEDGTTSQTYSDQFGSYTFMADSNKWYLVGGPRMNSAVVSTLTTTSLQTQFLSTQQVVASTLQFQDRAVAGSTEIMYSEDKSLVFDTTVWAGARASIPLVLSANPYVVRQTPIVSAPGATTTNVVVGPNTWTVLEYLSGTNTLTVQRGGIFEFSLVAGGGGGSAGNTDIIGTVYYSGGGGGGGGGCINTRGAGIYVGPGNYTVTVGTGGTRGTSVADPTNGNNSSVIGPGVSYVVTGGGNGRRGNSALGFNGNGGGGGSYRFAQGGSSGGAGSGSFPFATAGSTAGGENGQNGGNGGEFYDFRLNSSYRMAGGGGGGSGLQPAVGGQAGDGGGGAGGDASAGSSGSANTGGGGGGGGAPGGMGAFLNGGLGGSGRVQIRYTVFSTIYT
jgi:hypothetical protein